MTIDRSAGDGPVAVFLHYWGGTARTWDHVCARLPGVASVRFDQRGWGRSAGLPGPYGLEALADDVLDIVAREVEGSWVLVGHSMGGKVAMLAAARQPVGLTSLVLVAPAPPRPNPAVTAQVQAQLAGAYVSEESVRAALVTGRQLPATDVQQIVRDSLSGTPEAVAEWPARGITADVTASVAGLALPIRVLVGDRDTVETPDVLQTNLVDLVTDASMTVLPGVGHLVPFEAPEVVAEAVRAAVGLAG